MPQTRLSAGPPRLRGKAQQQEFGRQRATARCEKGVDPGGIGVERALHLRRQKRDFGFGGAIEAEHPHLPVGRDRLGPEDFGEPAGAVAPLQLHLEQPVLGMHKAEAEGGVFVVLRR